MATRRNRGSGIGDGDPCPISIPGTDSHGTMLVLNGGKTQYCSHQSHDGRGKNHPLGAYPATRKLWPVQWFSREVDLYRTLKGTAGEAAVELDLLDELPDLDDFDLEV